MLEKRVDGKGSLVQEKTGWITEGSLNLGKGRKCDKAY